SQAQQYRSQVRLHLKNPRLRSGADGRHNLYDDALCGHEVLQGPGSHPRDGIQR
ncbi:hypothetical protein NPIL_440531, partial [Nephila pilipes]